MASNLDGSLRGDRGDWTKYAEDMPCDGCGAKPSVSEGHGGYICEKCYEASICQECGEWLHKGTPCKVKPLACVPPIIAMGSNLVSVAEDPRPRCRNMAEQCPSRDVISVHHWRCCQLRKEHEGQHTDGLGCWP